MNHPRILLILGQTLTLIVACLLAIFFVPFAYSAIEHQELWESVFFLLYSLSCLSMIPISIFGINHAVAPKGSFKKGITWVSASFNALLLVIAVVVFLTGNDAFFIFYLMNYLILGSVPAALLLLLGLFFSYKEIKKPKITKTMDLPSEQALLNSDLSILWKLYEQQLITEQEYTEKKKEILNRDFAGK